MCTLFLAIPVAQDVCRRQLYITRKHNESNQDGSGAENALGDGASSSLMK